MWFERPGSAEPPVHAEPLLIVEGVTLDHLRRGPGHYPTTAAPGQRGNFAVSGHRTTYGAPFYHLDDLREGDLIHVVDRARAHWVYEFRRQEIVEPTALRVIGPDPLGSGEPTLTLTTCHPRFSAAQRLIVFATLVDSAPADSADA
jgi:sortase A